MKYLTTVTVFLIMMITVSSCSDSNNSEDLICDADALFNMEDAVGSMIYLTCYDSWAIRVDQMQGDTTQLIGASLDIPESFEVDGMQVSFTACFYEFDLPLLLPDPAPWGDLYVIRDFTIVQD